MVDEFLIILFFRPLQTGYVFWRAELFENTINYVLKNDFEKMCAIR